MRRFIVILIVILGIATAALASGRREPGQGDRAEQEVRNLERQLSQAVVTGDRAFFERVLAPDFTHTSHSGQFKTRAQWMAEDKFESGKSQPKPGKTIYEALDLEDLAVRIYGDTAVVTGRTVPKGRTAKGEPMRGRYRFLRVWVKRDGRWQAAAFQGTRIAEP
jgi:ketosteroid isomerase-like protein